MTEFREHKKALMGALDAVAQDVAGGVSMYALVDTEDPAWPFDFRWVQKAGATTRANSLINERLFDVAFLDFGFREVRDEDHLEGVVYKDITEQLADDACIGVAPFEFFEGSERVRMAHGIEDEASEEDPEAYRFAQFLRQVRGNVIDGEPAQQLDYEDATKVLGLLFKYEARVEGTPLTIVAFQRTQRMWIQQKSAFLQLSREGGLEFFSDRSLKVGTSFDFVLFNNTAFFRSLKALEGLFGFKRLMQEHARAYAEVLDHLVADYEKLEERIMESQTVVNKLLKLQKDASPVVDLPAEELAYRVKRIAYYSGKVNFNEQGRVMLVTNANVNNFLKLLGDNLLVSPLTQVRYETRSKRRLDELDEE